MDGAYDSEAPTFGFFAMSVASLAAFRSGDQLVAGPVQEMRPLGRLSTQSMPEALLAQVARTVDASSISTRSRSRRPPLQAML